MVLGGAIPLAILLSPSASQSDASMGLYFLALFLVAIFSLFVLISLVVLKFHRLLVIAVFLPRCWPHLHMRKDSFSLLT